MSREGIVLEHAGMNTAKIIRMSWKIKPSLEVGTGINPREIFLIITEVSGKNWRRPAVLIFPYRLHSLYKICSSLYRRCLFT